MKTINTFALLTSLLSLSAFAAPVSISFSNLGNAKGNIAIAVFNDPQGFPDGKAVVTKTIKAVSPITTITIDLPAGDYAISTFLDENMNSKLDTNFMGIPKERFGFSNNPKVQFSAPNFNECLITVESNKAASTKIQMMKFL